MQFFLPLILALGAMDSEEAITKATYEATAEAFAERAGAQHPKAMSEKFLAGLTQGAKVLDIGCGPGRDVKVLAESGLQVVGIDFSEKMIALARAAVPAAEFHVMDIEALTFPEESFDGIWANDSLLHIPKRKLPAVLAHIRALLKPKGLFYIGVKKGQGEGVESDARYDNVNKFYAYFEEEELRALLEGAGFKIVELLTIEKHSTYHTHTFLRAFCRK